MRRKCTETCAPLLLAALLCVLQVAHGHKCVHDHEVAPVHRELVQQYTSIRKEAHLHANPHIASRRSLAEVEPQPLRMRPIFQLEGLDQQRADFLQDRLMPAAIDVLSRAVKVRRPVQGNLLLPRMCSLYYTNRDGSIIDDRCAAIRNVDTCGPYARADPDLFGTSRVCPSFYRCADVPGGNGLPDADYVIYVTAKDMPSCSFGTVATGGFCTLDVDTGRPLAGFANFCPGSLNADGGSWGHQLETAVHEILHGLVMSEALFPMYRTDDGALYSSPPIGKTSNGVHVVVTPEVKRAVQEHFDCPSAVGAALEDGGGEGTSSSHWESRFFHNEIMQGASNPSTRQLLSRLTLALIQDSGWYNTDPTHGAEPSYGYQKGCSFLVESCVQSVVPEVFEDYYCPAQGMDTGLVMQESASLHPSGGDKCSWDHHSVAYCTSGSSLAGTCRLIEPYANGKCSVASNGKGRRSISFGDVWGLPNSRCLPVASKSLKIQTGRTIYTIQSTGASCWEVECSSDGRVMLDVLGARAECPPGGFLDLTSLGVGILQGLIGPCPEPEGICPFLGCQDNCNGNGKCVGGICQCHVGWQGSTCASPICGQSGGDDLCAALHGSGATCDLEVGACRCSAGAGRDCTLPEPEADNFSGSSASLESQSPPAQIRPSAPGPSTTLEDKGPDAPPPELPTPSRDAVPFVSFSPSPPENTASDEAEEQPDKTVSEGGYREDPKYVLGKTFSGDGYLQDCTIYLSSDGSHRRVGDPSVQTDRFGGFYLSTHNKVGVALELPSGGSCMGTFTEQPPVVPIYAPPGSVSLTPLSTLVTRLMATSKPSLSIEQAQAALKPLLGLDPASQIFRDDVLSLIATGSTEEAPAFAMLCSLTGAVTIASAWLSGSENSLSQRMVAAEAMMDSLALRLQSGTPTDFGSIQHMKVLLNDTSEQLSSLANRGTSRTSATLQIPRYEETVAAIAGTIVQMSEYLQHEIPGREGDYNQDDDDDGDDDDDDDNDDDDDGPAGLRFLATAAALARVCQGPVSTAAARLGRGIQSPKDFIEITSGDRLRILVLEEKISGPDVHDAVDVPLPPSPDRQDRDFVIGILEDSKTFLLSNPIVMYVGAGVIAVFAGLILCCCCDRCKRRRLDHALRRRQQSLSEADLIDAENLARALELSMVDYHPARTQAGSNSFLQPTSPVWQ